MAVLIWKTLPEIPPNNVSIIAYFKCPPECHVKHVPVILHLDKKGSRDQRKWEWISSEDSKVRFGLGEVAAWAYVEKPPWIE